MAGHQPTFYVSLGSWSELMLLVKLALTFFETAQSALLWGCAERWWLGGWKGEEKELVWCIDRGGGR